MVSIAPIQTVRVGSLTVDDGIEFRTELDSHADTCVVGQGTALLIQDFDQPVRVHRYDKAIGQARNCRTVSAMIAYDHLETGEVYYLVIHQAILIPQLTANLLSPMQLRDNDLQVNDKPKFMVPKPTKDHNAIVVPGVEKDDEDVLLWIPLSIKGVTSYFPSCKPTRQEWEQSALNMRIELTAKTPEWDPEMTHFQEQEVAMLDSN